MVLPSGDVVSASSGARLVVAFQYESAICPVPQPTKAAGGDAVPVADEAPVEYEDFMSAPVETLLPMNPPATERAPVDVAPPVA